MKWKYDLKSFGKELRQCINEGGMGMETNKQRLSRLAYASGWKCKNGKTLCPECAEKP